MQYIILIYGDEQRFAQLAKDPEAQKAMYAAYSRYGADMREAGVLRGGKPVTTDGPFAETKEQLGGYYLIDVKNLDEAVHWAARCPSALSGSIEVRPTGATVTV